ncbi:trigger factor [Methylophilaceae bacterium]|nr:trigger factor [Methylophilaceae bacterium]|tara:strand:+ start:1284 stop:2597 length:1314 start_codon:yes stop_codon:yes gene_type:complete
MAQALEKISNIERRVKVTVPVAPLQDQINQRFQQLTKTARVQGFRPGKVPLSIIKRQYGPDIKTEVYSKAIEEKFGNVIEENKIQVAGMPDIQHEPLSNINDDFEFTATFEIFPEVKDIDVKKINITDYEAEVKEKDVKKTIDTIALQRCTFTPVKRASKIGDKVNIKMESFLEGEKIEDTGKENIEFILGDPKRVKEIDHQIVGLKENEEKDFDVNYPKDHEPAQLANKIVKYHIKMVTVSEPLLPKIDAEFAKSLGVESGDIKQMNEEIKNSLKDEVGVRKKAALKRQIFAELVKHSKIELPKSLVSMEINRMMQTMQQNIERQGGNAKDINFQPEMFEGRAKETSTLRLVLANVVDKNKLHATEEQIKEKVKSFAGNYDDPEKAVKWFYEDKQRLSEPAALATEDNVVDWISSQCKKTKKTLSLDELMELQPNG